MDLYSLFGLRIFYLSPHLPIIPFSFIDPILTIEFQVKPMLSLHPSLILPARLTQISYLRSFPLDS